MSLARTAVVLGTLCLASAAAFAHPHVTRRIDLPLSPGRFTVQYFTVPYNETHLAGVPAGFLWHLGFATIEIDGTVAPTLPEGKGKNLPPGNYHLMAEQDANKKWSLALVPQGSGGAIVTMGREALAEKDEAKKKALVEKMIGAAAGKITLVTEYRRGGDEKTEHLTITLEDRGVNLGERTAVGKVGDKSLGRDFVIHVDFGDLHGSVTFAEPAAN